MTTSKCEAYLNFKLTETRKWKSRLSTIDQQTIPSISEMISMILTYRKKYLSSCSSEKINSEEKKRVEREFLLKYLFNDKMDEQTGLQAAGVVEEINSFIDGKGRRVKRTALVDSGSSQDSAAGDDAAKRYKSSSDDHSKENQRVELPDFLSQGGTEDEIASTYESISKAIVPAKNVQEIKRLYRGYKHVAEGLHEMKMKGTASIYVGIIDVDTYVLETHKILMGEVMDDNHTQPGKFSTSKRRTRFNDKVHDYPQFTTEEIAFTAVQMLVDKYNSMMEEICQIEENENRQLRLLFKCAALFLFAFLTLHPFGDGNGRLARLLCSYSLPTFSPFLTPIYNVFSSSVEEDYIRALSDAREGLQITNNIDTEYKALETVESVLGQNPDDLCAMIIESNWSMWRAYLNRLGIE